MKFARPLLLTFGMVVVVGAAGLTCALTPSIQRWAVLRAAARQPGVKLEVGEISAGFSGLSLKGVRFEQNGLRVQFDGLVADYSLWQILFTRRLQVHQLTANGILVDASRLARARTPAVAVGAPALAPGLLAQVELPFALVLDDCRLEGRALLPGAGKAPVSLDYKITGGKFAPGQEGSLLLTATVKNPSTEANVATLNAQVSLRATQTAQRTFARVAVTAVVDAEGRNLSEQNQLKIFAELVRSAAGEEYSASVDTLIRNTPENLLTLHATLAAGRPEYAGKWTLNARNAQLEPFSLGAVLPEFDVRGEGRFALTPSARAVDLQGSLQAGVSRLEAIEPAWRSVGAVKLKGQFDVAEADGVVRLRQLQLQLAGEQPVLELHAASAAEFNLKENRLQVGNTASGELLSLKLTGLPLAWIRPFSGTADVSGGLVTGGFALSAAQGRLLLHATEPLHVGALTVAQGGQVLLDKADIRLNADAAFSATDVQAKITGLTLKTPAGDALTGQATVTVPARADPPIAIKAGYTADLPALLARWLPLGRILATGDADFTLAGSGVELRSFATALSTPAGLPLLKVATLRPFSFDLETQRATTGDKAPVDLLRFTLGRIPLEHLPLNQPGSRLGGSVEQGEFILGGTADKLNLRAVVPLKLAGVALFQNGQPVLTGLAVEARPALELAGPSNTTLQSGEVTVRNAAGAALATLKAEATQAPGAGQHGSLTFTLEVPALGAQPIFAGAQAVSEGRASGEIRVAAGTTSQIEARLTVNGLVTRDGAQTLPVANLSFRGVVQENGKISVQAPLLLDRSGQRSDLNFSLDLTPAGRTYTVDGRLTGDQIELADAVAVLGVFSATIAPGEEGAAPAAAPGPVAPDAVSTWSRFNGQLILDIKSITRGTAWAMTGFNGLVTIDPSRLFLQKLEAAFGEKGRLAAKGDLRFGRGDQPYALAGDFSLTEFDAGKLFKAFDPAKPASVEGMFTVTGHLEGQGATVDQTMEQTRGKFELTSRQGVCRLLQRASGKVSMTSKAVELGASVLGSLLGSDKGTRVAEKVAGTAYFVDQLAQSLGEFNYDQLSLRLVRDETLNVTLEDISLVSPEIRLIGKGTVTHVAGKPLLGQPLNASFNLAGRGKIEQSLGKLRLLDGTRDELGYARIQTPVTLGGTLAKPDPSAFFTRIATAKLTDLLAP